MEQQESLKLYKPLTENSKHAILDSIAVLQELLQGHLFSHVRNAYFRYLQHLTKLLEDDMLWTNQVNQ